MGTRISELRDVTCHMGSHSVTFHPTQGNAPRLTPAMQAGTRVTCPGGMEGWVDLVDLIAPRPGVEPATFRSRVRRRTAAPPRKHSRRPDVCIKSQARSRTEPLHLSNISTSDAVYWAMFCSGTAPVFSHVNVCRCSSIMHVRSSHGGAVAWAGWARPSQNFGWVGHNAFGPTNNWPVCSSILHCGQLILRKISKTGASRYQILRLKCTKFTFCWGSAYSAPTVRPLPLFKGPTSKWMEGNGRGGRKAKGEGRGEVEGGIWPTQKFWCTMY